VSNKPEDVAGFLRNPGREARHIESELLRRLSLMGIDPDDSAAIRQLIERSAVGKESRQQGSMTSDILGLGLVLIKLVRQSSATGGHLKLERATRALVDAMLGSRVSIQ
jgi:hypothetical protein